MKLSKDAESAQSDFAPTPMTYLAFPENRADTWGRGISLRLLEHVTNMWALDRPHTLVRYWNCWQAGPVGQFYVPHTLAFGGNRWQVGLRCRIHWPPETWWGPLPRSLRVRCRGPWVTEPQTRSSTGTYATILFPSSPIQTLASSSNLSATLVADSSCDREPRERKGAATIKTCLRGHVGR